jgi:hypothetical protein
VLIVKTIISAEVGKAIRLFFRYAAELQRLVVQGIITGGEVGI